MTKSAAVRSRLEERPNFKLKVATVQVGARPRGPPPPELRDASFVWWQTGKCTQRKQEFKATEGIHPEWKLDSAKGPSEGSFLLVHFDFVCVLALWSFTREQLAPAWWMIIKQGTQQGHVYWKESRVILFDIFSPKNQRQPQQENLTRVSDWPNKLRPAVWQNKSKLRGRALPPTSI